MLHNISFPSVYPREICAASNRSPTAYALLLVIRRKHYTLTSTSFSLFTLAELIVIEWKLNAHIEIWNVHHRTRLEKRYSKQLNFFCRCFRCSSDGVVTCADFFAFGCGWVWEKSIWKREFCGGCYWLPVLAYIWSLIRNSSIRVSMVKIDLKQANCNSAQYTLNNRVERVEMVLKDAETKREFPLSHRKSALVDHKRLFESKAKNEFLMESVLEKVNGK